METEATWGRLVSENGEEGWAATFNWSPDPEFVGGEGLLPGSRVQGVH